MANVYNIPGMTSCANSIDEEVRVFNQTKQEIDEIISYMSTAAWRDDTNKRFVHRYNNEAKYAAEEISKIMADYASLLKQCARKFGNAIDNGNSNLSV